jgi:PAS domain S-box-containing protein
VEPACTKEFLSSEGKHVSSASSSALEPVQKLVALIIDDNPDDRALVRFELQKDFPELKPVEVGNLAQLENALRESAFDLVVTDYRLYWSNGLEILRRIKRTSPHIPVIMFTGTGNEEVAVEAMKAGVDDYVLKGSAHFDQLRAAVKSALHIRNQAKEIEKAELRYKTLFDTVPVGLFRCAPNGIILDGNPALAVILGVPDRSDLRGRNFADFHQSREEFSRWREELEREGSVGYIEAVFTRSDSPPAHVQIHARALRDPDTRMIVYEGSVEDITTRKQAETERENLISELRETCAKIKTLTGLLPICASCKKIRDEKGTWNLLESYIEHHSNAHFTHSFCPECVRRLYPEVFLDKPVY